MYCKEDNCITELIGVRDSCDENQDKIRYFLDYQGISLYDGAKIADEKYVRGRDLINIKIQQAYEETIDMIVANGLDLEDIASVITLGSHGSTLLDSFTGTETITVTSKQSCNIIVPYLVSISISGQGQVTVLVNDVEKFTGIINGVIDVDFYGEVSTIKVIGDDFKPSASNQGLPCQCSCTNSYSSHLNVVSSNGLMNGLMLTLQARCDRLKFLCTYREQVAKAVQYKAVALIYSALYESNNYNDVIVYNKDRSKVLAAKYDSDENIFPYDKVGIDGTIHVKEGKFQKQMALLNKTLIAPKCCAKCNDSITLISIP